MNGKPSPQVHELSGVDLLSKGPREIPIYPAFAFEGYPNRDSTPYAERYGIPEAHTILRGTLRYKGNPSFVKALSDIGLLNDEDQAYLAKVSLGVSGSPPGTAHLWGSSYRRVWCESLGGG